MKSKNLIMLASLLLFSCAQLLAQDKRTNEWGVEKRTNALEVGVEYLNALGDFKESFGEFSFGVAARYRVGITHNKSLLFSLGYQRFSGEDALGFAETNHYPINVSLIPAKFGVHFNVLRHLYVAGEIGATISLGVSNYDRLSTFIRPQYEMGTVLFNFSPSLGVQIPLKNKNYLDLSARYEGMSDKSLKSFAGFRAAYAFNIAR